MARRAEQPGIGKGVERQMVEKRQNRAENEIGR